MPQSMSLSFSTSQVIKETWGVLKQKWAFLMGVYAAMMGVSIGLGFVGGIITGLLSGGASSDNLPPLATMVQAILSLAVQVVVLIMSIGMMKIVLKVVRGQAAEMKELFSGGKYVIQYLLASLVTGLIIGLGFLLLVIPGIIWSLKYMFVMLAVVDDGLNFSEAMSRSAAMTEGIKWQLFGFCLALFGLNILGSIPFFLGLIITVPLTGLAMYVLYAKLKTQVVDSAKLGTASV